MNRTASLLAAFSLAWAPPVLVACQCNGCAAGCAPDSASSSTRRACCSGGDESDRPCCGWPGEQCPCSACSDPDVSAAGATPRDAQDCPCSAKSQPAAIATSAVQVDHSVGAPYFHADNSSLDARAPQLSGCLAALDLVPPARYGGLRVHAYLGVWLI